MNLAWINNFSIEEIEIVNIYRKMPNEVKSAFVKSMEIYQTLISEKSNVIKFNQIKDD